MPGMPPPPKRPLKIYSSDPLRPGDITTIDVDNEQLEPGPLGARVEVIDYDGAHDTYYEPVDLDDKRILMQGGLQPTESDPCSHQQMVYAVAMRVIESFDRALGRRVSFGVKNKGRLRIFPHAFHGPNAYFDRRLGAVLFGYFKANHDSPGRNLPGQMVYTCLSHDIIAHEVTHAIVHRLREYLIEPTNEDVLAFHEGFADIVALFQHFSYADLLREHIQAKRANLREATMLVGLAQQFGEAMGTGQALRSALEQTGEPRRLTSVVRQPHDRGSILVAAVFDTFFSVYQRRIRDLIRIATGGTGNLPDADLHPDLVKRVASEASKSARSVLNMCIRAFDFLPPVDVTFGDFLRALVTADVEAVAEDRLGQRIMLVEAFRQRGIFPAGVVSLAQESLMWPRAEGVPDIPHDVISFLAISTVQDPKSSSRAGANSIESEDSGLLKNQRGAKSDLAKALHRYARDNAERLGLDPDRSRPIRVLGFHPALRVAPDGALVIELVAQFSQQDESYSDRFGGIPLRGGTTVIAAADGKVRYVIAKPLTRGNAEAQLRIERQLAYLHETDMRDDFAAWSSERSWRKRVTERRMDFRSICGGGAQ